MISTPTLDQAQPNNMTLAVAAPPPLAYTISDAASAVGLSESYMRQQIRLGYLIVHYAGRKPIVAATELLRWLSRLPGEPA